MKKQHIVFVTGVILIAAYALGSYFFKERQKESQGTVALQNQEALVRPHSQWTGSGDARVTIVEFMDPGCETCRVFDPFVKQLMAQHPGKIRLVLRYAPLHHGADYMVAVLEAAKKQGRYWEALQVMYMTQDVWADHHKPRPELIWQYLPRAGLDMGRLKKEMNDPEIARLIRQDMADAAALGVTKTPGFFVNGKPLTVFGYDQLRALVEGEVRAKY